MTRRNVILLGLILAVALVFYKTQRPAIDSAIQSATETIKGDEAPPLGPLPRDVIPVHYDLFLTIVPEHDSFEGRVRIEVSLKKPTRRIWLHGDQLVVKKAFVTDADGNRITATYEQVDKTGVAKLTLTHDVKTPTATVELAYQAPFNTALEGLYKVVEDGHNYAFTQFEATSARLAFPGFDEPAFKVPFDITLTVPRDEMAVSNTPVVSETPVAGGLKMVKFATTKPLPTYLLAFAVGDLDVVNWQPLPPNNIRSHAVPLRGITAKGKGSQIKYALAHTAAILKAEETYFGIPYPYRKLDIIAAPDFAAGAMENAGAIVYREQYMLFDKHPSLAQKRLYAVVHAHELAHQWFGDLVTPVWWNDIWLNESFASWMEVKAVDMWRPKDQFGRNTLRDALSAMTTDSLISARQIQQPIKLNSDIGAAFDAITYQKGGGVLAMFENYLGKAAFRKGVQLYLKRHKFGVATSKDFLQALADGANAPRVVPAFQSFLTQPGVPLISVDWSCEGNGNTGADDGTGAVKVSLSQARYLPLGSAGSADQVWQVPICLSYSDDGARRQDCTLMKARHETMFLKAKSCPPAIMANASGAGYYRWSLPGDKWQALLAHADNLNVREKLSLEDSLWASVMAGKTEIPVFLAATIRFAADPAWDVAASPMSSLRFVLDHLLDSATKPVARARFAAMYQPWLDKLGLTPTTRLDKKDPVTATMLRRPLVAFMALDVEDPRVRAELVELGKAYIGYQEDGKLHPDAVDPNILGTALAVTVQELGAPYMDALMDQFTTSTNAILRQNILSALSWVSDPGLIPRVQGLMLAPELRDNEVSLLYYRLARHPATRGPLWVWIQKNLDRMMARMPTAKQGNLIKAGTYFCSVKQRDELRSFFAAKTGQMEGGQRALANTLERINLCIAAKARHQTAANNYFGGEAEETPSAPAAPAATENPAY